MVTKDEMRGYLLRCAEAFAGRRGRSGVINFLLGDSSAATTILATEQGILELFAVFKEFPQHELQQAFHALQQQGLLEIRNVNMKDKDLPLVYVTARGLAELELLRPRLPIQSTSAARLTERVILVLQKLTKLMSQLRTAHGVDVSALVGLSADQVQQYLQLFCKILQLRPETVMTSLGAQQHFVETLERALCTMIFSELCEVEAQCLRLQVGMKLPHQLDKESIERYYGVVSIEERAKQGASRVVTREWQARCQLASVLGFLALGEGK
ncbi:MAG: hypothetical protein KGZ50_01680 [Peptococcaceae bacterium]|nr:hypothetical protein [Peptococcaceae bacterium]